MNSERLFEIFQTPGLWAVKQFCNLVEIADPDPGLVHIFSVLASLIIWAWIFRGTKALVMKAFVKRHRAPY